MTTLSLSGAPQSRARHGRLADLKAVLYREFMLLTRNRVNLVLSTVHGFIYLLLLSTSLSNMISVVGYAGTEVSYLVFALPTVLMTAVLSASANSGTALFQEDASKMALALWSYPLRRFSYIAGKLIASVALVLVQAFLALGVGTLLFRFPLTAENWLALLLATLVVSAAFNALYMLLGAYIRDFQSFNIVVNLSVPVLLFSSPSFYSEESMPTVLRWISTVNPVTYGLRGLRDATIVGFSAAWPWLAGLAVAAAAGYWTVAWALLRRTRQML
ncbi:ABC transporter permease [Phytomonospora endophytica]|uniref:Transport permease protein n=1 Tax=Phytomonospora endophytica TaxID=714109 RepID=A0A841FVX6_9ACTN|nr:ABC transporter permease [Phytomonospora endophytica]MBB6037888.1 ABC-2 type transport system permease protein [Phytomonospora endophytica]GIG68788.1 hypothetical protein Pen01_50830 [Phytomonospora endophytica]